MRCRLNMIGFVTSLSILMLPLTSCTGALRDALNLGAVRTVTVCQPPLKDIPESAVSALEEDAKVHSETGEFMVSLAKTYKYQDACAARAK